MMQLKKPFYPAIAQAGEHAATLKPCDGVNTPTRSNKGFKYRSVNDRMGRATVKPIKKL